MLMENGQPPGACVNCSFCSAPKPHMDIKEARENPKHIILVCIFDPSLHAGNALGAVTDSKVYDFLWSVLQGAILT